MKNRLCRLGMHRPGRSKIYNHSRNFTLCADCGESLVARRTGWTEAPRGTRITWKRRQPTDMFARLAPNMDRRRVKPKLIELLLRRLPIRRSV